MTWTLRYGWRDPNTGETVGEASTLEVESYRAHCYWPDAPTAEAVPWFELPAGGHVVRLLDPGQADVTAEWARDPGTQVWANPDQAGFVTLLVVETSGLHDDAPPAAPWTLTYGWRDPDGSPFGDAAALHVHSYRAHCYWPDPPGSSRQRRRAAVPWFELPAGGGVLRLLDPGQADVTAEWARDPGTQVWANPDQAGFVTLLLIETTGLYVPAAEEPAEPPPDPASVAGTVALLVGDIEGWIDVAQATRRDYDPDAPQLTGAELRSHVAAAAGESPLAGAALAVAEHSARVLSAAAADAVALVEGTLAAYDLSGTDWRAVGLAARAEAVAAVALLGADDEGRRLRYDTATAWLHQAARGQVHVSAPPAKDGAAAGSTPAGDYASESASRVFGPDGTRDFL